MFAVAKRKRESTFFGRRLRSLREAAGLTLAELGEHVGMVHQAVGKYERGINEPTWAVVIRFAIALGVTPDAFLEADPDQPDDPEPPPRPTGKRK